MSVSQIKLLRRDPLAQWKRMMENNIECLQSSGNLHAEENSYRRTKRRENCNCLQRPLYDTQHPDTEKGQMVCTKTNNVSNMSDELVKCEYVEQGNVHCRISCHDDPNQPDGTRNTDVDVKKLGMDNQRGTNRENSETADLCIQSVHLSDMKLPRGEYMIASYCCQNVRNTVCHKQEAAKDLKEMSQNFVNSDDVYSTNRIINNADEKTLLLREPRLSSLDENEKADEVYKRAIYVMSEPNIQSNDNDCKKPNNCFKSARDVDNDQSTLNRSKVDTNGSNNDEMLDVERCLKTMAQESLNVNHPSAISFVNAYDNEYIKNKLECTLAPNERIQINEQSMTEILKTSTHDVKFNFCSKDTSDNMANDISQISGTQEHVHISSNKTLNIPSDNNCLQGTVKHTTHTSDCRLCDITPDGRLYSCDITPDCRLSSCGITTSAVFGDKRNPVKKEDSTLIPCILKVEEPLIVTNKTHKNRCTLKSDSAIFIYDHTTLPTYETQAYNSAMDYCCGSSLVEKSSFRNSRSACTLILSNCPHRSHEQKRACQSCSLENIAQEDKKLSQTCLIKNVTNKITYANISGSNREHISISEEEVSNDHMTTGNIQNGKLISQKSLDQISEKFSWLPLLSRKKTMVGISEKSNKTLKRLVRNPMTQWERLVNNNIEAVFKMKAYGNDHIQHGCKEFEAGIFRKTEHPHLHTNLNTETITCEREDLASVQFSSEDCCVNKRHASESFKIKNSQKIVKIAGIVDSLTPVEGNDNTEYNKTYPSFVSPKSSGNQTNSLSINVLEDNKIENSESLGMDNWWWHSRNSTYIGCSYNQDCIESYCHENEKNAVHDKKGEEITDETFGNVCENQFATIVEDRNVDSFHESTTSQLNKTEPCAVFALNYVHKVEYISDKQDIINGHTNIIFCKEDTEDAIVCNKYEHEDKCLHNEECVQCGFEHSGKSEVGCRDTAKYPLNVNNVDYYNKREMVTDKARVQVIHAHKMMDTRECLSSVERTFLDEDAASTDKFEKTYCDKHVKKKATFISSSNEGLEIDSCHTELQGLHDNCDLYHYNDTAVIDITGDKIETHMRKSHVIHTKNQLGVHSKNDLLQGSPRKTCISDCRIPYDVTTSKNVDVNLKIDDVGNNSLLPLVLKEPFTDDSDLENMVNHVQHSGSFSSLHMDTKMLDKKKKYSFSDLECGTNLSIKNSVNVSRNVYALILPSLPHIVFRQFRHAVSKHTRLYTSASAESLVIEDAHGSWKSCISSVKENTTNKVSHVDSNYSQNPVSLMSRVDCSISCSKQACSECGVHMILNCVEPNAAKSCASHPPDRKILKTAHNLAHKEDSNLVFKQLTRKSMTQSTTLIHANIEAVLKNKTLEVNHAKFAGGDCVFAKSESLQINQSLNTHNTRSESYDLSNVPRQGDCNLRKNDYSLQKVHSKKNQKINNYLTASKIPDITDSLNSLGQKNSVYNSTGVCFVNRNDDGKIEPGNNNLSRNILEKNKLESSETVDSLWHFIKTGGIECTYSQDLKGSYCHESEMNAIYDKKEDESSLDEKCMNICENHQTTATQDTVVDSSQKSTPQINISETALVCTHNSPHIADSVTVYKHDINDHSDSLFVRNHTTYSENSIVDTIYEYEHENCNIRECIVSNFRQSAAPERQSTDKDRHFSLINNFGSYGRTEVSTDVREQGTINSVMDNDSGCSYTTVAGGDNSVKGAYSCNIKPYDTCITQYTFDCGEKVTTNKCERNIFPMVIISELDCCGGEVEVDIDANILDINGTKQQVYVPQKNQFVKQLADDYQQDTTINTSYKIYGRIPFCGITASDKLITNALIPDVTEVAERSTNISNIFSDGQSIASCVQHSASLHDDAIIGDRKDETEGYKSITDAGCGISFSKNSLPMSRSACILSLPGLQHTVSRQTGLCQSISAGNLATKDTSRSHRFFVKPSTVDRKSNTGVTGANSGNSNTEIRGANNGKTDTETRGANNGNPDIEIRGVNNDKSDIEIRSDDNEKSSSDTEIRGVNIGKWDTEIRGVNSRKCNTEIRGVNSRKCDTEIRGVNSRKCNTEIKGVNSRKCDTEIRGVNSRKCDTEIRGVNSRKCDTEIRGVNSRKCDTEIRSDDNGKSNTQVRNVNNGECVMPVEDCLGCDCNNANDEKDNHGFMQCVEETTVKMTASLNSVRKGPKAVDTEDSKRAAKHLTRNPVTQWSRLVNHNIEAVWKMTTDEINKKRSGNTNFEPIVFGENGSLQTTQHVNIERIRLGSSDARSVEFRCNDYCLGSVHTKKCCEFRKDMNVCNNPEIVASCLNSQELDTACYKTVSSILNEICDNDDVDAKSKNIEIKVIEKMKPEKAEFAVAGEWQWYSIDVGSVGCSYNQDCMKPNHHDSEMNTTCAQQEVKVTDDNCDHTVNEVTVVSRPQILSVSQSKNNSNDTRICTDTSKKENFIFMKECKEYSKDTGLCDEHENKSNYCNNDNSKNDLNTDEICAQDFTNSKIPSISQSLNINGQAMLGDHMNSTDSFGNVCDDKYVEKRLKYVSTSDEMINTEKSDKVEILQTGVCHSEFDSCSRDFDFDINNMLFINETVKHIPHSENEFNMHCEMNFHKADRNAALKSETTGFSPDVNSSEVFNEENQRVSTKNIMSCAIKTIVKSKSDSNEQHKVKYTRQSDSVASFSDDIDTVNKCAHRKKEYLSGMNLDSNKNSVRISRSACSLNQCIFPNAVLKQNRLHHSISAEYIVTNDKHRIRKCQHNITKTNRLNRISNSDIRGVITGKSLNKLRAELSGDDSRTRCVEDNTTSLVCLQQITANTSHLHPTYREESKGNCCIVHTEESNATLKCLTRNPMTQWTRLVNDNIEAVFKTKVGDNDHTKYGGGDFETPILDKSKSCIFPDRVLEETSGESESARSSTEKLHESSHSIVDVKEVDGYSEVSNICTDFMEASQGEQVTFSASEICQCGETEAAADVGFVKKASAKDSLSENPEFDEDTNIIVGLQCQQKEYLQMDNRCIDVSSMDAECLLHEKVCKNRSEKNSSNGLHDCGATDSSMNHHNKAISSVPSEKCNYLNANTLNGISAEFGNHSWDDLCCSENGEENLFHYGLKLQKISEENKILQAIDSSMDLPESKVFKERSNEIGQLEHQGACNQDIDLMLLESITGNEIKTENNIDEFQNNNPDNMSLLKPHIIDTRVGNPVVSDEWACAQAHHSVDYKLQNLKQLRVVHDEHLFVSKIGSPPNSVPDGNQPGTEMRVSTFHNTQDMFSSVPVSDIKVPMNFSDDCVQIFKGESCHEDSDSFPCPASFKGADAKIQDKFVSQQHVKPELFLNQWNNGNLTSPFLHSKRHPKNLDVTIYVHKNKGCGKVSRSDKSKDQSMISSSDKGKYQEITPITGKGIYQDKISNTDKTNCQETIVSTNEDRDQDKIFSTHENKCQEYISITDEGKDQDKISSTDKNRYQFKIFSKYERKVKRDQISRKHKSKDEHIISSKEKSNEFNNTSKIGVAVQIGGDCDDVSSNLSTRCAMSNVENEGGTIEVLDELCCEDTTCNKSGWSHFWHLVTSMFTDLSKPIPHDNDVASQELIIPNRQDSADAHSSDHKCIVYSLKDDQGQKYKEQNGTSTGNIYSLYDKDNGRKQTSNSISAENYPINKKHRKHKIITGKKLITCEENPVVTEYNNMTVKPQIILSKQKILNADTSCREPTLNILFGAPVMDTCLETGASSCEKNAQKCLYFLVPQDHSNNDTKIRQSHVIPESKTTSSGNQETFTVSKEKHALCKYKKRNAKTKIPVFMSRQSKDVLEDCNGIEVTERCEQNEVISPKIKRKHKQENERKVINYSMVETESFVTITRKNQLKQEHHYDCCQISLNKTCNIDLVESLDETAKYEAFSKCEGKTESDGTTHKSKAAETSCRKHSATTLRKYTSIKEDTDSRVSLQEKPARIKEKLAVNTKIVANDANLTDCFQNLPPLTLRAADAVPDFYLQVQGCSTDECLDETGSELLQSSLECLLEMLLQRGKVTHALITNTEGEIMAKTSKCSLTTKDVKNILFCLFSSYGGMVKIAVVNDVYTCLKHDQNSLIGRATTQVFVARRGKHGIVVGFCDAVTPGSCIIEVQELTEVLDQRAL